MTAAAVLHRKAFRTSRLLELCNKKELTAHRSAPGSSPHCRTLRHGDHVDEGDERSASRLLLDRLVDRGVGKSSCWHDFDVSGCSIIGTLGTSNNAYQFRNNIPIINIGLRLADVEAKDLLAEPYSTDKDWAKVSQTLKRHGASEGEIAFLEDERVELNAMTSDEFITFIEDKFEEHSVEKLVPGDKVIERHARRMLEQQLIEKELKTLRPAIERQAAAVKLPDDFRERVEAKLEGDPAQSWDAAVVAVIEKLLEGADDEEAGQ